VCVRVAVNDAVVMREWGLAQKVEGKVLLLADAAVCECVWVWV